MSDYVYLVHSWNTIQYRIKVFSFIILRPLTAISEKNFNGSPQRQDDDTVSKKITIFCALTEHMLRITKTCTEL